MRGITSPPTSRIQMQTLKHPQELREAQLALEAKSENSEVDLEIFMA